MRVWRLANLIDQTCYDNCYRAARNADNRLRRRVTHREIACAVCGESFTPKRCDAVTCSNKCRQRLFRQRGS
jgi:hypothetical protein